MLTLARLFQRFELRLDGKHHQGPLDLHSGERGSATHRNGTLGMLQTAAGSRCAECAMAVLVGGGWQAAAGSSRG